jgi:hypothetical protein
MKQGKQGWGLAVAALALVLTLCAPAGADALWYNGDFDGVGAQPVGNNWRLYENFNVTDSAGWQVTSMFSNIFTYNPSQLTQAKWEIRTGMGVGNPGTVLWSGIYAASTTATGRIGNPGDGAPPEPEYTFRVSGLDIALPMGTYWMTVTPYNPSGFTLYPAVSTTSGANAVGTPAGNDSLSLFDGGGTPGTPSYYINPTYAGNNLNFSVGVDGAVVPEPAILSLLGLGLAGLGLLRQHRKLQNH